jgi:hypothetical protein
MGLPIQVEDGVGEGMSCRFRYAISDNASSALRRHISRRYTDYGLGRSMWTAVRYLIVQKSNWNVSVESAPHVQTVQA